MTDAVGRAALRAASYAAICVLTVCAGTSLASAETRTLKIYHLHTHEKEEIAYKRDGRFLPDGLKKINWILRDWRKEKPVNMDPRLLDLIWEAYRQSGSRAYINVVCGYRSPETNGMLRSRTSGVAKESQHMLGKAMDFYLPDVSLAKLRAIGLKMQIGGVGYYPRSGSPFVHFDVGNVRHWPKMSRKELLAVFPNGNTLHVPSDGKPLPGYEQALASYKSRKGASSIQVANASDAKSSGSSAGGGRTLLAMLFGGGGADEEEDTAEASGAASAPAQAARDAKPAAVAKPAKPAVEEPVAVAALAPKAKAALLPSGVPMPIQDTFDASAPKTMVPPAEVAETKSVEVAALEPSRIPLPSAAPVRETALVAEAMKVPVPTVPANAPQTGDSALLAALSASPAAEETAAGEAAQLAYSVPTPRSRPPFAAILKQETPSAGTIDEVRAIVETANAEMPPATPAPSTDGASVAALAVPAAVPLHAPAAHPQRPEAGRVLLASLEQSKSAKLASAPAAKLAIPAGKTGRLQNRGAIVNTAVPAKPISQAAISSRIRLADLVGDPNHRPEVSATNHPDGGRLVRNVPNAVLSDGFSTEPAAPSNGFAGSAVHFTPVVKVD
ncbi:DUF882 domain-containing protein [Aureimonas leprariae]|uniref:Murein endopeptidase K n=1 Tax=Plantimonas leprariae TaxID=2615207 RepID=A0A7V7PMY9_9HYPH|nr:DUF882 domain-containing protein [Aureimonas leprariae]KAB0678766.1 DUF882 domain-containing protein [Aureimonas leprariae]